MLSAFSQTYSPLEIVVSDQGSEDKTLEVIKDLAGKYDGKHKLSVLNCPSVKLKGMPGLNSHLNWLRDNLDTDLIVWCSADDFSEPTRTSRVVEEFEKTGADIVLTGQFFLEPDDDGTKTRHITAYPRQTQQVSVKECIEKLVAGSSSHAWTMDFFQKAGPAPLLVPPDLYFASLAAIRQKLYFIYEFLHNYIKHSNSDNTGLGGKERAVNGDKRLAAQYTELACYQIGTCYLEILKKMKEWNMHDDVFHQITDYYLVQISSWINVRNSLDLLKIQPMNLET